MGLLRGCSLISGQTLELAWTPRSNYNVQGKLERAHCDRSAYPFYPPGSHAGALLFRLDEESRRGYLELTQMALERLHFEELTGSIIVVTRRGIRIRKP